MEAVTFVNASAPGELATLERSLHAPDGLCVVIGNFDGVHRGHQLLFHEASREGLPVLALTFDPHPRETFGLPHHRLLTTAERVALLAEAGGNRAGANQVVVLQFDAALAAMSPEDFVRRILLATLHVRVLILGHDFVLGQARSGNGEVLTALGLEHGFAVRRISALMEDGQPISSSRIRGLLAAGDVRGAAHQLGRPHRVTGTVVQGFQRGRTIGFPTANMERVLPEHMLPGPMLPEHKRPDHMLPEHLLGPMLPAVGVYATRTRTPNGATHISVTNIGHNPTFGNDAQSMETHLLDFSDNLYGAELRVDFYERLRGEVKFSSVDELKAQIQRDTELARTIGVSHD